MPENWLKQVKNFNIDSSTIFENNRVLAKKLKVYILKHKEQSLANQEIQFLLFHIFNKCSFYHQYIENLDKKFVQKVFDELKNQKGYHFNLKLKSLNMEIATLNRYIKDGFILKNIDYKNDTADIILKKNDKIYAIQVKHKESIDCFLDTIDCYLHGMSMLNKYAHLRNKTFYLTVNQKSLNNSERKKAWKEVSEFIKNKKLKWKYITIENAKSYSDISEQGNISDALNPKIEEELKDEIDLITKNTIKNLNKQYEEKSENIFIGAIVWSLPFHLKSNFALIEKIMKESIKLPYRLDITLVPNKSTDKKAFYFTIKKQQELSK